jgi:hypothetical protein
MTDLTEQWKKGELPEGFYWVKVKEEIANYPILADCVRRYEYYDVYTYFPEYEDSITSVLAPVPTFDEWQEKLRALDAAYETIKMEDETINRLVRSGKQCNYENAQLKELLKDCQEKILLMDYDSIKIEILQKINEVLK